MRLSGFHIDGFGLYHRQGVPDLPPGLILFVGENECGKTTLMEFIRTMLFGWRRRDKRILSNDYPPLRGGNHGGRLQVVRQDGSSYTIQRLGRNLTLASSGGPPLPARSTEELLDGIDRATFERVFAVGLEDLQGLEVLSQEGVRSRLFSAGAGLGSTSVPQALQTLDNELNNLLLPGGQKQLIRQLLQELKKTESRLLELQGQAGAYAAGQQRREELEGQIRQDRREMEQLRQRLRLLELRRQARDPWVHKCLAQEEARRRQFAQDFPPHGLERWEHLTQELERLRREQRQWQEEVLRLEQQRRELTPDEVLLARQESFAALEGEREKLATALDNHPRMESQMEQAEAECRRQLAQLGPEWDARRLAQADTSVQVRQQVQDFARRWHQAERRQEEALAAQRALQEAAAASQAAYAAEQHRLEELPPPPGSDPRQVQQQQETVRRLRPRLVQRHLATMQLQAKVAARQEAAARLQSLARQQEARLVPLSRWWASMLAAAGLAGAAALSWQRSFITAGLVFVTAAGLAALLFLWRRRQVAAEAVRLFYLQEEQQQQEQAHTDLSQAVRQLEEEMAAAHREMAHWSREAGLEPPADLEQLELLAGTLDDAARQWQEWQAQARETEKAERLWRETLGRAQKAAEETAARTAELQRLQDRWQDWLAARSFTADIRPDGFEAVLQAVDRAREAQGRLEEYRGQLNRTRGYLTEARGRISRVLTACGRSPAGAEPGVADLAALRRDLNAALQAEQQQRRLDDKLDAARPELAQRTELEAEKNAARTDLLRRAGAADEDAFRRLAAAHEEWRGYRQQVEANEIALRQLAGTAQAQTALEEELQGADPLAQEAEMEQLQTRLQDLADSCSQADREYGKLEGELAGLARSQEQGEWLLKQRSLREQLAEATRRWATLVVCRHLLEQARGVYERERQPQVIREAGRFLQTMAPGRYRLISTVGEADLKLEDLTLRRKEEYCWSAGLKDQVYLAVRLGLAREFGRRSEPLPVILDDVLVKFDPLRRRGAARVILEFSREQQVLLFSCHPEFQELIAEVRQEAPYRDTPVACFRINDGEFIRVGF